MARGISDVLERNGIAALGKLAQVPVGRCHPQLRPVVHVENSFPVADQVIQGKQVRFPKERRNVKREVPDITALRTPDGQNIYRHSFTFFDTLLND